MAAPFSSFNQIWSYPNTTVTGSSGSQTNATATATLPAVANKTNFVTGFDISSSGTIAAAVAATLTGAGSGTMTYQINTTPAFSSVQFSHPIPATALNTAITLSVPALGASGVGSANIYGFLV